MKDRAFIYYKRPDPKSAFIHSTYNFVFFPIKEEIIDLFIELFIKLLNLIVIEQQLILGDIKETPNLKT